MQPNKRPPWRAISLLIAPILLAVFIALVYWVSRPPANPGASAVTGSAVATAIASEAPPDFTATANALRTQFPVITPNRPTGIFDAGAELWHEGYRIQNAWAGPINGVWAYILAGAYASDAQRGVIQVSREYPGAGYARFYDTPVQAGSVKITAENGGRLTLQATNGTLFYFDIPSESYVPDLSQPVPSLPPPPTHTPSAVPTAFPSPGAYPGLDAGTPSPATAPVSAP